MKLHFHLAYSKIALLVSPKSISKIAHSFCYPDYKVSLNLTKNIHKARVIPIKILTKNALTLNFLKNVHNIKIYTEK